MLTHVLVQGRMAQGKRILLIGDSVMYLPYSAKDFSYKPRRLSDQPPE